jgi:hypothetical protein
MLAALRERRELLRANATKMSKGSLHSAANVVYECEEILAALPVVEPPQVSSLWSDPEFLRSYAQSIENVRDGVTPRGLVTSDEIDGLLSGALPVLETPPRDPAEDIFAWIVERQRRHLGHAADRCWGVSSDSLVYHALDPSFPLYAPSDPSDLMACARTVAMAPPRLQPDLLATFDKWRVLVWEKYPQTREEGEELIQKTLGGTPLSAPKEPA